MCSRNSKKIIRKGEALEGAQNKRDEILQRIGGVEASAERNDARLVALGSLLKQCKEEFFQSELLKEELTEEELEEKRRDLDGLLQGN